MSEESRCLWTYIGNVQSGPWVGDVWVASCNGQQWYSHAKEAMKYCPHCGDEIIEDISVLTKKEGHQP